MAATRLGLYGGPRFSTSSGVSIATAALSGTLDGSLESDIEGKTLIWTLTNDTFVAAGTGPIGSTANSQALIDSITGSSTWNTARGAVLVTDLVRTSDTVATLTLSAAVQALYDISADDSLTSTIPGEVLTGAVEISASGSMSVNAIGKKGGHVSKRARKRYVLEVDGQLIVAGSISEVEAILANVRDIAEESAERDVKTEITPKPPRVKLKTGSGKPTTSQVLQKAVKRTQKTVNRAYNRQAKRIAQDAEISRLLIRKFEQEDNEERIIRLLLM